MKIALVIKEYGLERGGAERHTVHLGRALAQGGHDVHVLSRLFQEDPASPPIHWHPVTTVRKPSWWKVLSFARKVSETLRHEAFDIVYALNPVFSADIYRMSDGVQRHWLKVRYPHPLHRGARLATRPVLLVNLYLENRLYRRGGCRRVVANSRLFKETLHGYYGVSRERIEVIYNGVDHRTFNPQARASLGREARARWGLPSRAPVIVFAGNDWKRKGLFTLLKAMDRRDSGSSECRLLVAGRGSPRKIERMCSPHLRSRIHLPGAVREIQKVYAAGDLLVLPTRYDPFSNVCLEAMACGLPVITTAANGAAELVREGVNGYVQQEPDSAEELAGLLRRFLDGGNPESMKDAARATASAFTWEEAARRNLELFKRLLREKKRGIAH